MRVLGFLVVLCCASGAAAQEQYPAKPIRLIVPSAEGGVNDLAGRLVARNLAARLGQPVVVENLAGGNGIAGLQALRDSAPDGYTLGLGAAGPLAVNPGLYEKLPYDPLRDFTPISGVATFPLLLVVNPSTPAKTLQQVIHLAMASPFQLYYASPGAGSPANLAAELFNRMAKVRITHVPYKSQGPAMAQLLAGQVDMMWAGIPTVLAQIESGKLRAIAIGSAKRLESLPDVPTVGESGVPGYEAYSWLGLIGPAKLSPTLTTRLSREVAEILKGQGFAGQLLEQGAIPDAAGPREFSAYIRSEIEKWGKVVRAAGIKPD